VTEWARASRDGAYLYTGSRLDTAVRAAARIAADARQTTLSPQEAEFLRVSSRAASRAVRRRRGFTAAIAVLAAGLAVALVIATQTASRYLTTERSARAAQGTADRERDSALQSLAVAVSGQLASESLSDADTYPLAAAQQQSVMAYALNRTSPQAEYALSTAAANPLAATISPPGAPASMAFSPDGKTLAIGEAAGVELYDAATGSQIGDTLTGSGVPKVFTEDLDGMPVAFSPDGKTVAAAEGSAVIIWNTATQKVTDSYVDGPAPAAIDSLAFSPDGKLLATGSDCPTLGASADCGQLWNAATGATVGSPLAIARPSDLIGPPLRTLVAFAPDGKTLATAAGGVVQRWSVATQRPAGPAFPPLPATVTALTFSPDGGTLVTGDQSGAVRLWNVATARQSGASLSADGAGVNSAAFSPSGSLIAEGDDNGLIRVWDVATRRPVGGALSGGTKPVSAVAFSPDGATLAGADADATVSLWTVSALAGHQADAPIPAGSGTIGDGTDPLVFGPGGEIFTTDDEGDVTQWNTTSGNQDGISGLTVPATPDGDSSPPMALSPDGRTLATGMSDLGGAANNDGTVWLWNVTAAKPAATTIPVPQTVDGGNMSMTEGVQAIAFSPDGREFAVAYADGNAQVFDTATRQPFGQSLLVGSENNMVDAMTFGGTGDQDLITLTADGEVNQWNWRRPAPYSQPTHPVTLSIGSQVNAAAFSPDATTLAIGQDNGTVLLWDVATNQQIGPLIQSGNGAIGGVAFSPDGTTLATSDSDDTIRLWNVSYLNPTSALAQLCADIGGGIAQSTWTLYAPSIPYRNACA
jgi:WD40 repeat protein